MRTIPSRLALLAVLALAAPALVVHGRQNPEAMPQAGLVRLLDDDKVAFGVTVDARADPIALSADDVSTSSSSTWSTAPTTSARCGRGCSGL